MRRELTLSQVVQGLQANIAADYNLSLSQSAKLLARMLATEGVYQDLRERIDVTLERDRESARAPWAGA